MLIRGIDMMVALRWEGWLVSEPVCREISGDRMDLFLFIYDPCLNQAV